jgi:hypothetical protein
MTTLAEIVLEDDREDRAMREHETPLQTRQRLFKSYHCETVH